MSWLSFISHCFLGICSAVVKTIGAIRDTVNIVLRVNYEVVSTVYYYTSLLISTLTYIVNGITYLTTAVFQYTYEFLNELFGCVCALCVLIWRILVLLYKVICLILTGIETLAIVLWTGSYVTVKTLKQSVVDIYDYCGTTWKYALQMLQDLGDSIIIFFTSIGNTALMGVQQSVSIIAQCLMSSYNGVINVFVALENFVLNFFGNVVYFYTSYLPSLGKETYLGIIICCFLYLAFIKFIYYLNYRGMTLFTRQRHRSNSLVPVQMDSDDDISDHENNVSVISDSSEYQDGTDGSDDNDSDAMSETTVDDDDDSELSLNSQTFSSSEDDEDDIEVELPSVHQHYGLRNRSTTPKRSKSLSPEEFEREIEKEKDKRKCVVCQDQSKCVLILPCRHMCLCVGCANQIVRARYLERRVCPLCRQRIQKVMNVYT